MESMVSSKRTDASKSEDRVCWSPHAFLMLIQSNPVNTDIEGSVKSVCINGVPVLSGLNLEKMKGVFSPGTKQTVRKRGSTVVNIMIYNVRTCAQVRSWGSLLDLSSILLIEIY